MANSKAPRRDERKNEMTALTKPLRTPAEIALIERFGNARSALPGTSAIQGLRDKAFASFERQGLPHRRVEDWKYSDLRARLKSVAPLSAKPDALASAEALRKATDAFAGVERYRLVFVDGFFAAELSDRDALLKEGVEVAALSGLLASEGETVADLLSVPEIAGDDIAIALNTAFAVDGVIVFLPEGSRPSKPIELLNIATSVDASAIYTRNRLVVGAGVEATILESSLGGAEGSEINMVTEYRVGDGANLTVARLQAVDFGATHIATNLVSLGEKTQLKHLSVEAGAGFSRNQTFLGFAGQHSRAEIFGVSMVHERRHIDQTLVIDHAVPNCESAEVFKTIVDDRASGVFQGKIIVRPDAQKTNGKMMSQALLLSEEAEMAAKPELEIYADDVVCGHGATVGQIDATMLFYLMARGIPRADAERLLIEAFLADAVDSIGNDAVAEALKGTISASLHTRKDAGGVTAA